MNCIAVHLFTALKPNIFLLKIFFLFLVIFFNTGVRNVRSWGGLIDEKVNVLSFLSIVLYLYQAKICKGRAHCTVKSSLIFKLWSCRLRFRASPIKSIVNAITLLGLFSWRDMKFLIALVESFHMAILTCPFSGKDFYGLSLQAFVVIK